MTHVLFKASMLLLVPALLLGCGADSGDDDSSLSAEGGAPGGSEAVADRASNGASDGDAAPAEQSAALDRKVIFTSDIELGAEDVAATFHRAGQVARSVGGYVESSDLRTRGEGQGSASVRLRVPAAQIDDVLQQLRGLTGTEVVHEGSHSTEVTEEYTDLESRLRNLEAAEARYLDLLTEAETIEDILTVTDRIDGVRLQIEQIQGRLRLLDEMVDLATVNVLVTALDGLPAGGDGAPPTPAEALADAWAWSLDTAAWVGAGAVYVAIAAAWLAVPAGVVALIVLKVRGSRPQGEATPT